MVEQKRSEKDILRAVALKYQPEKNEAPIVAASGMGRLAERIVSLAAENKIPIVEDTNLARILAKLLPGEEVPRELYEAIAAVYAFIMEADRRKSSTY